MEQNEKLRQDTERLGKDVRTLRELIISTRRRTVEQINALCSHNDGELNLKDLSLDESEFPTVCYDGDGDNCCADPYATVLKIKARRNKDWKKCEYDGFAIEISSEMAYATLYDNELSYDEIESIFEFISHDEVLPIILKED